MKLILLRHGESEWNLENRFTGWKDVSLTPSGKEEAKFSANQLLKNKFNISSVYTSILNRAIETTDIVCNIIDYPKEKIIFDWRLNERHYGALQGLNKSETALKYGEEQVHIWRRSYSIQPPLLSNDDKRHPRFNSKFKKLNIDLPIGESLEDVTNRINPFLKEYLSNIKNSSTDHIIIAHSNSLRAIIKLLDKLSQDRITEINIPTGVPLVYELDSKLNILSKEYLINKRELKKKQDLIIMQGRKNNG
tara:strand:- start:108 stop:854 length:747 start_codon:yes stop_codon:yes gene_type:complete